MVSALEMRKLRKVNQLTSGHTARKLDWNPGDMTTKPILKDPFFLNTFSSLRFYSWGNSPSEGLKHTQYHLAV